MSDDKITEIFNATRPFSYKAFARAIIAASEEKIDSKAIAWDVSLRCARIPGANFYTAAEMAIDQALRPAS